MQDTSWAVCTTYFSSAGGSQALAREPATRCALEIRERHEPGTGGAGRRQDGERGTDTHTHALAVARPSPGAPFTSRWDGAQLPWGEASTTQPILVPALMLGVYLHPKGGRLRDARAQGNLIITLRICHRGPWGQRQSRAGSNQEQEINSNSSPFTLDKNLPHSPTHHSGRPDAWLLPGQRRDLPERRGEAGSGRARLWARPTGTAALCPSPQRLRFTGRVSINRNTRRKSTGRLGGRLLRAERCPESIQRPCVRLAPRGNAAGPGPAGWGGAGQKAAVREPLLEKGESLQSGRAGG